MLSGLGLLPLGQINISTAPAGAAPETRAAAPVTAAPANTTGPAMAGATSTTNGSTTSADTQTSQPAPAAPGFLGGLTGMLPIILMFVALYFILFRGQRKDEKKRKAAISELKKGDRVMTIGGMVANVVSIDGDDVVLKIDESANVKARYRKTAIQEVLGDEKKASS